MPLGFKRLNTLIKIGFSNVPFKWYQPCVPAAPLHLGGEDIKRFKLGASLVRFVPKPRVVGVVVGCRSWKKLGLTPRLER